MKNEPLKYHLNRWPAIISLFGIGVFGCIMLNALIGDGPTAKALLSIDDPIIRYFPWVISALFICFGFIGSVICYLTGHTYYRKSKLPLSKSNSFVVSNGLVVDFNNKSIFFDYNYKKMIDRGYVRLLIEYDRKKEEKHWHYLTN